MAHANVTRLLCPVCGCHTHRATLLGAESLMLECYDCGSELLFPLNMVSEFPRLETSQPWGFA